ncbi:hypothetical protein L6164_004399 [Bauhinia variegata]|uniref:Uncharacterized protein n=1 Tax=Bauhinia variegata TaxID=167791 RepID=A0ACB9Q3F7_BAUVA|nr:hypothetical protein L6164_004399 [Bauhinia variegata]
MALLTFKPPLPSSSSLLPSSSSFSSSRKSSSCNLQPSCIRYSFATSFTHLRATLIFPSRRLQSHVVRMAPEEEKITRRSPLDFPIEWERPKPGRRPDIFPQFSPMKTPLPPPLPADPPEEDEEEEEKKEEEEEDPEKEETEKE